MQQFNMFFLSDITTAVLSSASIFIILFICLISCTIGGIITNKAGNSNLAMPGMMLIGTLGGIVSGFIVYNLELSGLFSIIITSMISAISGIIGSLLFSLFTITFKAQSKITGIIFSFFSLILVTLLIPVFVYKLNYISGVGVISALFSSGVEFEGGLYLDFIFIPAILFLVIILVLTSGTRFALRIKAASSNLNALSGAGISSTGLKYSANMFLGALSGVSGYALLICFSYIVLDTFLLIMLTGFIAIGCCALSNWKKSFSVLGSFIISLFLSIGFDEEFGSYISSTININLDFGKLIYIASIILVLVVFGIGNLIHKKKNKPLFISR